MTSTYKLLPKVDGLPVSVLRITDVEVIIPFDPLNTDYQEYEAWLSAGNLPEPADPLPVVTLRCSKRQAERALLKLPVMVGEDRLTALHLVEAHIEQEPDPIKKREMQAEFNAAVWEESNPFLQQMWEVLEPSILDEKPDGLRAVFELALTF